MLPRRNTLGALLLALVFAGTPMPSAQTSKMPMPRPAPVKSKPDLPSIPAPEDVAAPPATARRTASGLAWRLLGEPAAEPDRPTVNDVVKIRYTGWTTDGAMFDSTEVLDRPREFRVTKVVPGFEEALQLLSIGEKGRFWIPEELAYAGAPGKPQGTLVFDLELLEIDRGPQPPLPVAAPPADARRSDSGLAWVVLEEGRPGGVPPRGEATLLVQYSSWTPGGRLLDTTVYAPEPKVFSLHLTIAGFREAFSTMIPGERRMLWIPAELTELDGRRVHDDTVVFEVTLESYLSEPERPASFSSIPPDAETSPTGLAWKVLSAGHGERHPADGDTVEVIYSGWTTDGEMFDAAYLHGRPGRFELGDAMPVGWNEALYGMVEGEERIAWIPEDIAYGGQKGRPTGMLVFRIELVSIEPRAVDAPGGSP